jgi:glycosyltransferase involved in cell wall biosynthesis
MRIAMIGSRGVPASYGGIERHVEEIGARLADRGHEVTVFTRPGYVAPDLHEYRGMRLRSVPAPSSKHMEAFVHSGLAAAAATSSRYDVVHFHAIGPGMFTPVSRYVGRQTVVQTIHGLDHERAKWGRAASTLMRTASWTSQHVPHAVIGCSRDLAAHYARVIGDRAYHVANGVTAPDPATADGSVLAELGLRPQRYIVFVGRLVPEKAPDVLVRAFRRLADPDVALVLVGGSSHTDDYTASLRELAAGDPRVVLPGYVYGARLTALYSSAAAFALPSLLEGLPLTLLEGASYGLPIVASDIPPHREVLHHDALGSRLVPPGDDRALEHALQEVLADQERAQARAADVRSSVLSEYSWDTAAEQTLAVYEEARVRAHATRRARHARHASETQTLTGSR